MPDTNPLLQNWTLPPWSAIRAEHLLPAINVIVAKNRQIIAQVIASQTEHPGWDDLVVAIDEADARLDEAIGVIETLSTVKPNDIDWLRESALCSLVAAQYTADKAANLALYRVYQRLAKSSVAASFDDQRKASLAKILRKFRLSGIELPPAQQQKLTRLNRDIKSMEQLFKSNLELANAAWSKRIDDVAQLEGLSAAAKARLALNAKQAGHDGWLLTLDQNTYRQILTHAQDRALREAYFTAWLSRASDQGPRADKLDNHPVLTVLVALRHEKARVLGFENYVQLRLENRMASSPEQVAAFLRQQVALNKPALLRDTQALKAFAHTLGIADVQAWDEDFLAEQLRVQQLNGALKGLRQYFPLDGILRRLCQFSERLFGIRIVEQTTFSHWHDDVRLFEVSEHGQVIGYIYFDPYHREEDADYAFTTVLRIRRINAEGRPSLPIARLYSNFTAATDEHPCLLSHENLRVLFHEFGHCLQHVLTRSPHRNLAGISQLGRDTAEFAGQLFEHFCLSPSFLLWLAAHYQSGEQLTEARVNTALAAIGAHTSRTTAMLLMTALFDLQLHCSHGDSRSIEQVFKDVQREVPHLQLSGYHRFANGFDYLVTGYEASVYAYKWSGVLATEVFERFQRDGVFDPQTGRDFRDAFFAPGDSRSLLKALETFLDRPINAALFAATTD
ncbi:oligopeptidase A [Pseudomonas sp. N40(2020)]|uniref:M3 family metallopeptidase n=1 Tax=Pseudomonas sp. N40(2020) TaxID=2767798 RepID=UPI001657080C|nr:M3 family metallopeptidase [Pseudomonas sp. N40(2020)]MBC8999603.1 oligopeptidase A [Pseudomonas sp. N40(2020)]